MENLKMNAEIKTVGFKPSEIRPRKMWTVLQDDLLELYNDYCALSNDCIPELNKVWETNHPDTEEEEKDALTPEEQEIKDLKDQIQNYEYGCYMRDAFDACAFAVNERHPDSYLSGFVFMDGSLPVFAARIKQHPEMTMSFVIK